MQLIIMRHGEAGYHSLDRQRELTEFGRQSVADVAAQIAESPWRPRAIWCSPLVRARQTAAIASEILNCPVEEKSFITPDDDPGECLDAVLEIPESPLMIVSHMPLVGSLATLFVDGHRHGIPLMTAQAIVLDMPVAGPGCADLKAQFMP
ncbi:histidine phosphatase family protein [Marinobacter sp. CHS3-4]|uniref:SixA phosphatase family protein n=1 Tax=Marinobacter sp. CHS3-4 TaxID=3045174 RepID=UPI0024B57E20|nr:histidine phosphatase family protein [Marinobacter sp. CHS3-4]MDI9245436.1 histidine phosphatase family protein [Marinobacter sp. CHS3-4]